MNLPTGSKLGPYQIERLIASGGMADVYRAHDPRLDRTVALKVIKPAVPLDSEQMDRFAREARTTALVSHPNIVCIYDVGSHNGIPFVVSEMLYGETLRARLKRGALPVRSAVGFAIEIAGGLAAAHAVPVIHRDLKPENIFITRDERTKILDFGLAKCRRKALGFLQQEPSKSTAPGTILGTVGYMSPEQARGEATDARSDIFSVGVILHEMLAGAAPFHGDSAIETLHAILTEDAPPLPADSPPALAHVVRHCLEKDPDARFQSARDLAFVLEFTRMFAVCRHAPPPPARTRERTGVLDSILALF
jgi:serine/threonine protein kinase